jgi:AraC-like DNA-binding protein
MRPSRVNWVPPGAWLAPRYAEWEAPVALRGQVACLWASVVPDGGAAPSLILPDACSDLIWEEGTGAYVAGPDTGPARTPARPGAVFVGVRFRPAAGGPVLGLPLSNLTDQRVPLADLLANAARRLPATLPPAEAAARLVDAAGCLIADASPDPAMNAAVSLLHDPAARVEDVAARLGLSERQFRRRSHAAVGYGPKTLQRILRFQRFVRLLDAAREPLDLAETAASLGFADQSHLTRDCTALSGLTPAALAKIRRPSLDNSNKWPVAPVAPVAAALLTSYPSPGHVQAEPVT